MKTRAMQVLLVATTLIAASARAQVMNPQPTLRDYADLIRAQGEYALALSEARLIDARAQLLEAERQHQMELTRRLRLLVNRMEREFRRLQEEERQTDLKIDRIERSAATAGLLNIGKTNDAVFIALHYLMTQVVPTDILLATMTVEVGPFDADDFKSNKPEIETVEFEGENAGQLFDFIKQNKLSLVSFGKAHVAVLEALTTLREQAVERIAQYEENLLKLRNNTLDPWNPELPSPVGPPRP